MVYLSADNNVFGGFVSGGSGSAYWGSITGNIDNQTDLIERLCHVYEITLNSNSWEFLSSSNMYVQTSSIPKIKSTDYVVAYIKFSDNKAISEKEASYWNKIEKIAVFDGYIETYVNDEAPDIALNVVLKT